MLIMSATHFIFSIIVLIVCVKSIRTDRPSLLAITAIGFIIIDSLGVAIAPYLPLSDINYLNSPTFVINFKDQDLYLRQLLAHWVFFLIILITTFARSKSSAPNIKQVQYNPKIVSYLTGIMFIISIIAYARYFIFGPGLDILLSSRLSFGSTSEAIASRVEIRYFIENGQGAYLASVASKVLLPIVAGIATLFRLPFYRITWFTCFVFSAVYAFQTREKSPLIASVVMYTALYLWGRMRPSGLSQMKSANQAWILIPVAFVFFIGGAGFYAINFGLSWQTALQGIFARTLAIPGATETNFFAVFPDIYDFRGISNIFKIPLLGFGLNDISIYEVAIAATGDGFSTNSSMIAVGWSGAGYLGVAIVSVIISSLLAIADYFLLQMQASVTLLAVILSIPAFVGLTSGSITDYLSWGGMVSPMILIGILTFAHHNTKLSRKDQKDSLLLGSKMEGC